MNERLGERGKVKQHLPHTLHSHSLPCGINLRGRRHVLQFYCSDASILASFSLSCLEESRLLGLTHVCSSKSFKSHPLGVLQLVSICCVLIFIEKKSYSPIIYISSLSVSVYLLGARTESFRQSLSRSLGHVKER
jgi:hypothetical protein